MKRAILLSTSSLAAIAAALATIALVVAASGNPAVAASSLVNGNFETGDLTGWTVDTTNGGDASAAASYEAIDPSWYYCESGCVEPTYLSASPHEGSRFARLTPGEQSAEYTTISQPFTASNGDKVSGWAFTGETLLWARGWETWGYGNGQVVVLTNGSGTTVATLFEDSGRSGGDLGNSPWKYWEHTFADLTGEGQFQIEAQVQHTGQVEIPSVLGLDDVKISTLAPDTTKPSTSATPSVQPNAEGWNNKDVTVKLKATDNEGGWGVKEIAYRINGGPPITKQGAQVNSPLDVEVPAITGEDKNTIAYYATDRAGNVEDEKSLQVNIDKTRPEVDVSSLSPVDNAVGVSPSATLSVTFLESGSGINPSTLTDGFRLFKVERLSGRRGSTGDEIVSGKVSYEAASKRATFTPSRRLATGAYYATINESLKDKAENYSDYKQWSFSVG